MICKRVDIWLCIGDILIRKINRTIAFSDILDYILSYLSINTSFDDAEHDLVTLKSIMIKAYFQLLFLECFFLNSSEWKYMF